MNDKVSDREGEAEREGQNETPAREIGGDGETRECEQQACQRRGEVGMDGGEIGVDL